jgi:hypothetical protein
LPPGVDIFCMRSFLAGVALSMAVLSSACSVNQATSNVATLDGPARQACSDLKAVIQARSTGLLDARELQGELAQVYASAATSVNPIIRARAVAVLADATQIAAGGEGRSLTADLAALNQACSNAGE